MYTFRVGKPDRKLLEWFGTRLDPKYGFMQFDDTTVFSVLFDSNGEPIVAVALDEWTESSCAMSVVSDGTKRWATPFFICSTYEYIFDICRVNRIGMLAAADNKTAIHMNRALGHVQEGIHRDYFGVGRDALSFSFLRRDWEASKWYERLKRASTPKEAEKNKKNEGDNFDGEEISTSSA